MLVSKLFGFEVRLCWKDVGVCWDVSQVNVGSIEFFNGCDVSQFFQLYYSVCGMVCIGELFIKGEMNQVIVIFDVLG